MLLIAETAVVEEAAAAATETAESAAEEVGRFTAYLQEHIPELVSFGIKVLLAILFFLSGTDCNRMDTQTGEAFAVTVKSR